MTLPIGLCRRLLYGLAATIVMLGLAIPAVQAAIYKVAFIPNGNQTHTDLQVAIDAAIANPSDDEIRLIQGSDGISSGYSINMSNGDDLLIGGGWNADFTVASPDASLTTLGGVLLNGRVFTINVDDGDLILGGLTVTGGKNVPTGGGISVSMTGGASQAGPMPSVTLFNLIVRNNEVSADFATLGGGVFVSAENNATFTLGSSVVSQNAAISSGGTASGGGVHAELQNGATAFIALNNISDNIGTAPTLFAVGIGLNLEASNSTALLSRNFISGSTANGGGADGVGMRLLSGGNGALIAEAQQVVSSVNNTPQPTEQVQLGSNDTSIIAFRSSWIASGSLNGVDAQTSGSGGTVNVSNLTVYNHSGLGIRMDGPGNLNLAHSISYLNGTDLVAPLASQFTNLIGVNPQLLNPNTPAISPDSPAVDAGGILLLECGPGIIDVFGQPRFNGPAIDIGAYETQLEIFADGFEDPLVLLKRLARLRPLGGLVNC